MEGRITQHPPIEVADARAFMASLDDDSVHLAFTSPPYNIGKSYEKGETMEQWRALQRDMLQECWRVLVDGGYACWQVGTHVYKNRGSNRGAIIPLDFEILPLALEIGFTLQQRIIWHFNSGLHSKHRFSGRHEVILCLSKGRVPHFDAHRHPDDVSYVWEIPNVKANHPEKTEHPCQFPIELAERCILAMTRRGDTVIDMFAGVGTTAIAALKNHRHARSCDRDPAFVATAERRLADLASGRLGYRPMGKPVHLPKHLRPKPQLELKLAAPAA